MFGSTLFSDCSVRRINHTSTDPISRAKGTWPGDAHAPPRSGGPVMSEPGRDRGPQAERSAFTGICEQCRKPFSRGRPDKRFCSDACRTRFGRERTVRQSDQTTVKAMAVARDAIALVEKCVMGITTRPRPSSGRGAEVSGNRQISKCYESHARTSIK